jgi:hypothetical protein
MKPFFALLAGLLLIVSNPCRVWAWGDFGHRVIAQIAFDNLNDTATAKVKELIQDCGYTQLDQLAADGLGEHASQEGMPTDLSLLDISVWPDHILALPEYRLTTYPWHYTAVEYGQNAQKGDIDSFCHGNNCLTLQIDTEIGVLSDATASIKQKFVALVFLTNLVGDAHVPLNCADYNDQEGSAKYFMAKGHHEISLHGFWNNLLSGTPPPGNPTDYARDLETQITADDRKQWQAGTVYDWVWESYMIAATKIYPLSVFQSGPQNVKVDSLGFMALINGNPKITKKVPFPDEFYTDEYKNIVQDQLRKAGLRLAWLLNNALGQ